MKTGKRILPITWTSNGYADFTPDKIVLDFTDRDVEVIEKARAFLKENPSVICVHIEHEAEQLLNEDDTENTEYRADYQVLQVYSHGGVYWKSQSQHDASVQIETDSIFDNQ